MTRLISRQAATRTALLALAVVPSLALAHTDAAPHVHSATEALAAGFAHPFTGLDHMAAMVALGIWSALATKRIWVAPLAFASALLIGALFGMAGFALPAIEPMIAASVLVLGLLVATNARLPLAAGALLAAGFALFHGVAHGAELAGPQAAWSLIGMVSATALLHGAGLAAGKLLQQRSVWAPRVAGAAVALFGASLLIA
jgi:urease accessory protein